MRKFKSENGLIYEGDSSNKKYLSILDADRLAKANGFVCAERLVKELDGKEFSIDDDHKILEISEDFI